jgi:hypothetical protein
MASRTISYVALTAALLALTLPSTAIAGSPPNVVKVGIYVLQIGKVDLASGTYTIDFYLSLQCTGNCTLGSFEFIDGRATSIVLIENETNHKFYRIEGEFFRNLDLQNYPFDSHILKIEIEDTTLTKEQLVYEPDPNNTGMDQNVIVVGWVVSGWYPNVVDHYYAPYNQTYSRYIFTITIARPGINSAINMFLPVFFLVFISLVSMLLTGSRLESRIVLTVTALLAAVFFQFTLDSTLPPLGYFTFADKFMIATYSIMVSTLVFAIILLKYNDKKDMIKSEKIQYYSIRIMPVAAVLVYALTFLIFL